MLWGSRFSLNSGCKGAPQRSHNMIYWGTNVSTIYEKVVRLGKRYVGKGPLSTGIREGHARGLLTFVYSKVTGE